MSSQVEVAISYALSCIGSDIKLKDFQKSVMEYSSTWKWEEHDLYFVPILV